MFIYFLPDQTAAGFRESVAFQTLAPILRDAIDDLKTKELRCGPADVDNVRTPGVMLCALPADRTFPQPLRYDPTKQTWLDCGGYWLGYLTAQPPHPELLARDKQVEGYTYTLADGREYNCPIIRRLMYQPMLPCGMRFNGTEYVREVKKEWQDLWQESAKWSKQMSDHERAVAALTCLQMNYRVGPYELEVLGTFADEQSVKDVILAALDEQFFIDCLADPKKKASVETMLNALEHSAALLEAISRDTAPAEENSTPSEFSMAADIEGG